MRNRSSKEYVPQKVEIAIIEKCNYKYKENARKIVLWSVILYGLETWTQKYNIEEYVRSFKNVVLEKDVENKLDTERRLNEDVLKNSGRRWQRADYRVHANA